MLVYAQVGWHEFLSYDDDYVSLEKSLDSRFIQGQCVRFPEYGPEENEKQMSSSHG